MQRFVKAWVLAVLVWASGGSLATAAEPLSPALRIPGNRMAHDEGVTSVAYSPDGKTLASGSLDQTIKLWDVATGKEQACPYRKGRCGRLDHTRENSSLANYQLRKFGTPSKRPAQRLLSLRPAYSLSHQKRPVASKAPTFSFTGWNDSCRAGFAPAEDARLCTAHSNFTLRGKA
jgi:WD domain, G-beta repeat